MAQSAASVGGVKNPLGANFTFAVYLTGSIFSHGVASGERWGRENTWGVVAKHAFNPTSFYFNTTLTAMQIEALPVVVLVFVLNVLCSTFVLNVCAERFCAQFQTGFYALENAVGMSSTTENSRTVVA